MQPLHSIEFELTTEMATKVQESLVRWELRRGWRRDVPKFVGAAALAGLIVWAGLVGWMLPAIGAVLLCVLTLFVIGAVFRRVSLARGAAVTAVVALHTNDRLVRIDFGEDGVRLETEFYRGEGAWTELDRIVVLPGYWVLQLSNGGQILLPDSHRSPELEAFLRGKADQVMAKIWHGT